MKCTSCNTGTLNPAYLEGLFPCHTCDSCAGNFVMMGDYLRWREQNQDTSFERNSTAESVAEETEKAMVCPKTGRLMTKYKISKDSEHRLDLSPTINAIWLDAGEWLLLKENGLAGKLNNIFTDHWQHEIRSQESADILTALYERKFGSDYDELKVIRDKLNSMDARSEAIAYILAEDPYKP